MNTEHIRKFIIESELISMENLKKVDDYVFEKNVDFSDALQENSFLDKEILSKISANIMGVNKINLGEKIISLENFKIIPELISQEHNIICFFSEENSVHIAFSNIKSLEIIDTIFPQNIDVKLFLADNKDILEKKKKYLELISEELSFKNENNIKKISRIEDWGINSEKDLPENFRNDIANDLYTEKFIVGILEYALNNKADFIFFNISENKISISLRIFDRNYNLMKIEKNIWFSILLKLKQFSDVNIFEKYNLKQSVFVQKIFKESHNIFLTFIKTDFGESATIQLDKNKKFKTEIHYLVKSQRGILLFSQRKDSGFLIFSGENKIEKKKTLYSFLEFDVEKNKEIYLLEKNILHPLDYTKQITIKNSKNILSLLPKIFESFPDVLFVEKISQAILPIIFNYVSTSKKVFISNELEIGKFLDMVEKSSFDKGQMVKNFSLFIEHKDFKKINNKKKYFLKNDEIKIFKNFFSEKEISEIFKGENLDSLSKKSISEIEFFTEGNRKKSKAFFSSKKSKNPEIFSNKKISLRGILNLGLFLENSFLKRYRGEKIKNSFRKEVKKVILENAIVSCNRGEIDIKEILKYLTR